MFHIVFFFYRRCDKICKLICGNPSIKLQGGVKVFKDFTKRLIIVINPSGYRQKRIRIPFNKRYFKLQ